MRLPSWLEPSKKMADVNPQPRCCFGKFSLFNTIFVLANLLSNCLVRMLLGVKNTALLSFQSWKYGSGEAFSRGLKVG